jgi:Restriction endonuclease
MRGMEQQIIWGFVVLSVIAIFLFFSRKNLQKHLILQKNIAQEQSKILQKSEESLRDKNVEIEELKFHQRALHSIIDEKSKFFPWLLAAKTEYGDVLARRDATFLERKKHPAVKASETVKQYRAEARKLETLNHRLIYRERYLGKLFPWLSDFLDDDISELVDATDEAESSIKESDDENDPALAYLTPAEFQKLSEVDRNQLALDRFVKSRKTKWQIGREFERYVGYSLEEDNYKVSYDGAVEGFLDLGRNLIATKKQETLIVQCKYWREDRTIHEKHIYQLYGTFCDYVISKNLHIGARQGQLFGEREALQNVKPVFLTTGTLSPRAKLACQLLGVDAPPMRMEKPIYPSVKCNISQTDGEKIYHLPFDQQYDRVRIDKAKGECFLTTCHEAEKMGFRRAWRWSGNAN